MAEVMSCAQVEELLALVSLGALDSDGDEAEVTRHLAGCPSCRQAAAGFAATADLLPDALPPVEPPARLRRNLMAEVYAEATGVAARRPALWRRLWERLPSGRAFTIVAGAAVAAAVALGAWGAGRSGPAPQPTAATYSLTGTTAEPAAAGTLTYDRVSGRGVLEVRGLQPPAASGRVYEVWLIPAQGVPVPAGFLTLQPDGRSWTGVISGDVPAYRTVAATIEPDGGTPAPTGTEVLSGTLG